MLQNPPRPLAASFVGIQQVIFVGVHLLVSVRQVSGEESCVYLRLGIQGEPLRRVSDVAAFQAAYFGFKESVDTLKSPSYIFL